MFDFAMDVDVNDKLEFLNKNKVAIGNSIANLLTNSKVDGLDSQLRKGDASHNVDVDVEFGRIRFCSPVRVLAKDDQSRIIVESAKALIEIFQLAPYGIRNILYWSKDTHPKYPKAPEIRIIECSFNATSISGSLTPDHFQPHLNGELTIILRWESNFHLDTKIPKEATIELKSSYAKLMFNKLMFNNMKYEDLVKLIS